LRWRWLALLAALGGFACSGGDGLHPVQGKVLHKDRPAQGVLVTFHPAGENPITALRPIGTSGEDGSFTLSTGQKEGAPAGVYVVTLIWPEAVAPKSRLPIASEAPDTRDRLRGAYANRAKSAFKVEIIQGDNQLKPFHLK
jgi:hypothetical protein